MLYATGDLSPNMHNNLLSRKEKGAKGEKRVKFWQFKSQYQQQNDKFQLPFRNVHHQYNKGHNLMTERNS